MQDITLDSLVEETIAKHPDRRAVRFDDGQTQKQLSYDQLGAFAQKVKQSLAKYAGEFLGVCMKHDVNMHAVLLGILQGGGAFYNFNVEGFGYAVQVLKEIGARACLVHKEFEQFDKFQQQNFKIKKIKLRDPDLSQFYVIEFQGRGKVIHRHEADYAYCITTSGTTGKPKTVWVPHDCVVPNILHLREIFGLTPEDTFLCATSLTFDPVMIELFTSLSVGACLLVVPPKVKVKPDLFIDIICQRNKVTVMQTTPSVLYQIKGDKLRNVLLGSKTSLRVLALGGEHFPAYDWILRHRGADNMTRFFNLYGITELSVWATCYEVTKEDFREHTIAPVGSPLAQTDLRVENVQKQGTKSVGELVIDCIQRRCKVSGSFQKSLATGDFVEIDEQGNWFYQGRADLQVKRNGIRINLQEINMVTQTCQFVGNSASFMLKKTEKLVLAVSPANGDQEEIREGTLEHLKRNLPSHWIPDDVFLIDYIPVTDHGKADITQLEKAYLTVRSKFIQDFDVVKLLSNTWMEMLNLTALSSLETSNFIDAGGTSIKAVHLQNLMEEKLKIRLPFFIDILVNKCYTDVKSYLVAAQRNASEKCESIFNGKKFVKTKGKEVETYIEVDKDIKVDTREETINDEATDKDNDINIDHKLKVDNKKEISIDKNVDKAKQKSKDIELIIDKEVNFIYSVSKGNCYQRVRKEIGVFNPVVEKLPLEVKNGCEHIQLEPIWKFDTTKCVDAAALIAVGQERSYVYVGSHSYQFTCLDLASGEVIWAITLPFRITKEATLSLCGRWVLVSCTDGYLYVFCAVAGEITWQFNSGAAWLSTPVVDVKSGHVYVRNCLNWFFCLSVESQVVMWSRTLDLPGSSHAAVSYNPHQLYFISSKDGMLCCLHPVTGETVWQYLVGQTVLEAPVITSLGILVSCAKSHVFLVDFSGNLIHKHSFEDHMLHQFTIMTSYQSNTSMMKDMAQDTLLLRVFFGSSVNGPKDEDKKFFINCFDINKGTLIWRQPVLSKIASMPFLCLSELQPSECESNCSKPKKPKTENKTDCVSSLVLKTSDPRTLLFVTQQAGCVWIFDADTGDVLCHKMFGNEIWSAPVVHNSRVVFGCRDNFVHCLSVT
ncbi:beta-alanine-activating enzyme-like isoform X2 [Mya arenaria]|uniref:beta-alanine-activating enzyme-like isoform X2 n=1 Tax=Mya arenaria TaxID=6604 RepID=UPI0022E69856|nr:beta-alanine-activating enzyme-like isoform X2 [Mya arenaria]